MAGLRLSWERKLPDAIKQLRSIYAAADAATRRFAAEAGVSCPPGCGVCCERFTPDVSDSEAEIVARHLITTGVSSGPEETVRGACPFYDSNNAAHCRIYPARPSVCRLFGFSGVRDKHGTTRFRACRHAVLRCSEGAQVPLMVPLMSNFTSADGARGLLPVLVDGHLNRLLLVRHLTLAARAARARVRAGAPEDTTEPGTLPARRRPAS